MKICFENFMLLVVDYLNVFGFVEGFELGILMFEDLVDVDVLVVCLIIKVNVDLFNCVNWLVLVVIVIVGYNYIDM